MMIVIDLDDDYDIDNPYNVEFGSHDIDDELDDEFY